MIQSDSIILRLINTPLKGSDISLSLGETIFFVGNQYANNNEDKEHFFLSEKIIYIPLDCDFFSFKIITNIDVSGSLSILLINDNLEKNIHTNEIINFNDIQFVLRSKDDVLDTDMFNNDLLPRNKNKPRNVLVYISLLLLMSVIFYILKTLQIGSEQTKNIIQDEASKVVKKDGITQNELNNISALLKEMKINYIIEKKNTFILEGLKSDVELDKVKKIINDNLNHIANKNVSFIIKLNENKDNKLSFKTGEYSYTKINQEHWKFTDIVY